jgi:hypothetical protein
MNGPIAFPRLLGEFTNGVKLLFDCHFALHCHLEFVISKDCIDITGEVCNCQFMGSHYAMKGTVRYYGRVPGKVELRGEEVVFKPEDRPVTVFDFHSWKEPPHLALANLMPDPHALYRFVRHYGIVTARLSSGVQYVTVRHTDPFQEYLQKAWKGDQAILEQMVGDLKAYLRVLPSGIDIVVEDLWTLVRLMFLHDWWSGRARKCSNPDCLTPYFLAVRKGQKLCSQTCAVLINVRRFREREAEQKTNIATKRTKRGKHVKAKKV